MNREYLFSLRSILLIVGLSLLLTGCSLFAPKSDELTIDSDPQGAEVIIPGLKRQKTPCVVSVPSDKNIMIIVRKQGYVTREYTIKSTLGKCGVLDVCGCVLWGIPAIGLFSPGAYTLEQHIIYVPFEKMEKKQ